MCVWNRTRNTEWRRTFMSLRFEGEVFDGFFTVQEKMKNVKMEENPVKNPWFFWRGKRATSNRQKSKTLAGFWGLFCCGKRFLEPATDILPQGPKKQTDTDKHRRRRTHTVRHTVSPCVGLWLCLCLWLSVWLCLCLCGSEATWPCSILPVPSTQENIMCSLFSSSLLAPCLNVQVFALMRPNTLRECQWDLSRHTWDHL